MRALYLGNEFVYESPPLRSGDGKIVAGAFRALLQDAGGRLLQGTERPASAGRKPGTWKVQYSAADVDRLVGRRVGQVVRLVLECVGKHRFTVELAVTALRPPGA